MLQQDLGDCREKRHPVKNHSNKQKPFFPLLSLFLLWASFFFSLIYSMGSTVSTMKLSKKSMPDLKPDSILLTQLLTATLSP